MLSNLTQVYIEQGKLRAAGELEAAIAETLANPEKVILSLSDPQARLYHRFYVGTRVGDKFLRDRSAVRLQSG